MDASTPKMMMLLLALALWGCVSGQNYPGASQYWTGQPQQQQQQQPHQFQQPFQQQQQQLNGLNGYRAQQPQQDQLQQGLGVLQQQADQHPGLRQQGGPLQPQQTQQPQPQQQSGFRAGAAAYGRPLFQQDDKENVSASTSRTQQQHFQSRLFGQQGAAAGSADGPGEQADAPSQPGQQAQQAQQAQQGALGQRGLQHPGLPQQDNRVLELEPHGAAKQPQPDRPDSQVFHSTGSDHSLYALDWSYPRARHAPTSLMLKRWGGLSPPEYVAVYRLRGPGPAAGDLGSSAPSYTLAHDELRHYPWDLSRRHGPPRWRGGAPRDEDFELLPGTGYGLGHHGGNHQYMYRTL